MTAADRLLALCLGCLAAMGPLSMDMYLAAMPAMAEAFGVGHGRIELTISAFFVGFCAGQLVLGPVSDRVGRRPVALAGLGTFAFACVGCTFSGSLPELLAWRVLQGLGGSVGMVIAMSSVRDRFTGNDADRMMGVVVSIIGVAPVIAPLIGSLILQSFPWEAIFLVLGVFTASVLGLLALFMPETLPPERRAARRPADVVRAYGNLFRDAEFIPYATALTLTRGSLYTYIAAASPILITGYGLSPLQFGTAFSLNAVGLVIASQVGPRLSGRLGASLFARLVLGFRAVVACILLAFDLSGWLPLAVLLPLLFLLVASLGFAMPTMTTLSLAAQGRAAGTASALLGGLGFGFGAVLSSSLGMMADSSAGPLAVIMAVTTVGAALVASLYFRRTPVSGAA
ncbi:multidrug effflux MFS transporter [Tranquillimonas rosea]|uniref:multidrug effflux MFS transporter n=1 Tax=Tranquillimonas rosea TaxID=641238 RepID=UPI003BAB0F31